MSGGAGITVYMRIDNSGSPSRADGFVASIESGDATYDLFPAELPSNSTYADETGEIHAITRADTLYEMLRNPIVEGGYALGFLFYFAKDISAAHLTAKVPPEIVIRFRDVRKREYVVTSEGHEPSYPPGVRDPFLALPRSVAAVTASSQTGRTALNATIEQVTFYNTKPLLLAVQMLIENRGAPSAAKGWYLSFKAPSLVIDRLKVFARQKDVNVGPGVMLYKKDSLIDKVDVTPVLSGTPVRGWLDYYIEGKELRTLRGQAFEMVIDFQDTFGREGTATFSAVIQDTGGQPVYFPGVESSRSRAEESKTLPANRRHVALDRLYELGREGKAMLERIKQNQEPIPTSQDVDVWADNLAAVASSVGSYAEKGSFKVHYQYLGLPSIVLNVDGYPTANAELAKSIKAKLSLETTLIARLLEEDMAIRFMPPS